MHKIKGVFFVFLLFKVNLFFPCPLCLSIPKNAEKPFFIDENADYIEESVAFLDLKEPMPVLNNTTGSLTTNK